MADALDSQIFSPATARWFSSAFERATEVQRRGWEAIARREHALLIAPTGSGKTLAAFLWAIDRTISEAVASPEGSDGDAEDGRGTRVVYVSPLKALAYDIERNLRAPLIGIARSRGEATPSIRVDIRTGDTPRRERRRQRDDPGEILVTTPESLYLILGSRAGENFGRVHTVIVDEIHALAPTKRGAHLALSLERLAARCDTDPQRIGLSATVEPPSAVAAFLGGDRDVAIVDTSSPPRLELTVRVPVDDMTRPTYRPGASTESPTGVSHEVAEAVADGDVEPGGADRAARGAETKDDPFEGLADGPLLADRSEERVAEEPDAVGPAPKTGIWPAIYPEIVAAIQAHRTTLVFVNSRGLCERLAKQLNEEVGEEWVRAHHGSVAHAQRSEIEEALKRGELRAIVATSSLELGIDMGTIDLVVLVESPGSAARGLQRVGRSGHGVGETSRGLLFPKHRGDLLEATVVAERMLAGALEPIAVPERPLDVLAQHLVAACTVRRWSRPELAALVRRTASYRALSDELLGGVLDMLSGNYPSADFSELRPLLHWDRERDELRARRGAKMVAALGAGTIPDRGTFGVFAVEGGARVGELDEEMVYETRPGQTIILGASTWRVHEISKDRVLVTPAPGEPGRLPFWRGEGPGRPISLGRALGRVTRELDAASRRGEGVAWLQARYPLDERAAKNLDAYLCEQREHAGVVPTDEEVVIERYRDELGDWRVCILTPFGSRIHAPWALAIQARIGHREGITTQVLYSDDGIVLRLSSADDVPPRALLVPTPEEVEELVVDELANSSLFASQFRENAGRALLMPSRRPGKRTPLWAQRHRAQQLLNAARRFPSFPIILETYRSCLRDVFDLPGLTELLRRVRARELRVTEVETTGPSPFSRSLAFAWVAEYVYEGDVPLAERRAHALALDREMLRELLGEDQLRGVLDSDVIDAVVRELQWLAEDRRATDPERIVDMLRRLGDLTRSEVAARADGDAASWLRELDSQRRVCMIRLSGDERWISIEDAGLYRDAFGVSPPAGVPSAFLRDTEEPLGQILRRFARTHGPFQVDELVERYPLDVADALAALEAEERAGRLAKGHYLPRGSEVEWCDETVLRRIRRRSLAALRDEIAAVEPRVLARFLPAWHGVSSNRGRDALVEAVRQIEGVAIALSELDEAVLPARVDGYLPTMLDELGVRGRVVWIGMGALGGRDGRVALFERGSFGRLEPGQASGEALDGVAGRIAEVLEQRGASFAFELSDELGLPEPELTEPLLDLVWAGIITNDSLAALRALLAAPSMRRRAAGVLGGRWSLVSSLARHVGAEERMHARAVRLLERHGVVVRRSLDVEHWSGGFSAYYPVFRAMEDAGQIRRGHFIEGMGGAQFASPGAVDRLRSHRVAASRDAPVVTMAGTDPANPYGWLIDWPALAADVTPRRASGTRVIMRDGELLAFLDRSGERLTTNADRDGAAEPGTILEGLRRLAMWSGRSTLRVLEIDGEGARGSELGRRLIEAGAGRDYKAIVVEGR